MVDEQFVVAGRVFVDAVHRTLPFLESLERVRMRGQALRTVVTDRVAGDTPDLIFMGFGEEGVAHLTAFQAASFP